MRGRKGLPDIRDGFSPAHQDNLPAKTNVGESVYGW